ncbi:ABC transporter ATP-binding protein [Rhodospirillaceae bacterium SYSU D60014]|uniref:ABC transporter ATP-binding protein n=1 Tax=Virgifigura deserti TaxID=2268457 RepID=UPI000E67225D
MSNDVKLDRVTMRFGSFTAVRDASLTIGSGEFFSFLGPSGCGKTTLLRLISGFIEPSEGRVLIGGQEMAGIGPNKRPTALIFQNLALFPLMTVAENIAFGLEVRGVAKAVRRRRALELLDLIALPDAADKKVMELSGGQRQRVAIARALAVEPKVMLLDEPLSALDLKLRQHMRGELRAIQRRTGVTFVYITHDQGEALTMSDRVAVMSQGRIEQIATAAEIYDAPQTPFVASFVGENNPFHGRVSAVAEGFAVLDTPLGPVRGRAGGSLAAGDRAVLFARPERLRLVNGQAVENAIESAVLQASFEGSFVNLILRGAGQRDIVLQVTNDGSQDLPQPGDPARVAFRPDHAIVLPDAASAAP